MAITKIERSIIVTLYNIRIKNIEVYSFFNEIKCNETSILDKKREIVYFTKRLKKKGLVDFEGDFYAGKGEYNNKYNNNAVALIERNIDLTMKGEEVAKKISRSFISKSLFIILEALIMCFKKILKELINKIIYILVGVIGTLIISQFI